MNRAVQPSWLAEDVTPFRCLKPCFFISVLLLVKGTSALLQPDCCQFCRAQEWAGRALAAAGEAQWNHQRQGGGPHIAAARVSCGQPEEPGCSPQLGHQEKGRPQCCCSSACCALFTYQQKEWMICAVFGMSAQAYICSDLVWHHCHT